MISKTLYEIFFTDTKMTGKAKEYWIEKLGLQPHPKEEKGFFRETHRLVQWLNLPTIFL